MQDFSRHRGCHICWSVGVDWEVNWFAYVTFPLVVSGNMIPLEPRLLPAQWRESAVDISRRVSDDPTASPWDERLSDIPRWEVEWPEKNPKRPEVLSTNDLSTHKGKQIPKQDYIYSTPNKAISTFLPLDLDMAFNKWSFSFVYIVSVRVQFLITVTGSFLEFLLSSVPSLISSNWTHQTTKQPDQNSV